MKDTVFIEGGGPPTTELNGTFAGLTEHAFLLQTAFYRLFEQEIPELKVIFDIQPSGGYRQTLFAFVNFLNKFSAIQAYVVLDFQELKADLGGENAEEHKKNLFALAEDKISLGTLQRPLRNWVDYEGFVFFMVQKMEAWIISQPDIIYDEFKHLQHRGEEWEEKVKQHLGKKKPNEVLHPDRVTEYLLGCFEEEKKGKWKKVKYGKIQTASKLLPKLSLKKLMDDFEDVNSLVKELRHKTQSK